MAQPINDRPGGKAGAVIMISIIVVMIVVIVIGQNMETNQINKSGVYVIGKIIGVKNSRGFSVFYTYEFAGHKYREETGVSMKKDSVKSFYLVKINPKTPTEGLLLEDYCLGDSNQLKQPDSGWRENPMGGL